MRLFFAIRGMMVAMKNQGGKTMHAALVIMAAGIGSRYGGSKQTDGVGPTERY